MDWVALHLPKLAVLSALGLVGMLGLALLPFEFRRARRDGRSLLTGRPRS